MLPPLEIITVDILAELRSHAHSVFFFPFSLNLQRAFSHIIPFFANLFEGPVPLFLHHNLFNLPPTVGLSGDFQIVLMVENPGSYTCVHEAPIST